MSQFTTSIPINISDVLTKLPARSYVETVKLAEDRKSVQVVWGCDDLKTGYTFPVEYPLEKLLQGNDRQGNESPIPVPIIPLPKSPSPPKRKR